MAEVIYGPEIVINKSLPIPDGRKKAFLEHALLFISKNIFTWATLKKHVKSFPLKILFKSMWYVQHKHVHAHEVTAHTPEAL